MYNVPPPDTKVPSNGHLPDLGLRDKAARNNCIDRENIHPRDVIGQCETACGQPDRCRLAASWAEARCRLHTTRAPHSAIRTRDHLRLIRLRAICPAKGKITSTIATPNSTCAENYDRAEWREQPSHRLAALRPDVADFSANQCVASTPFELVACKRRVLAGTDQCFRADYPWSRRIEDDDVCLCSNRQPTFRRPLAEYFGRPAGDLWRAPESSGTSFSVAHFSVNGSSVSSALAPGSASPNGSSLSSSPIGAWSEQMMSIVPSASPATIASRSRVPRKGGIQAEIRIEVADIDVDQMHMMDARHRR